MDEKYVSAKTFTAVLVVQLSHQQQLLEQLTALLDVLREKRIVNHDTWQIALKAVCETPQSKRVHALTQDLEKMLESASILDILKDFSGTIQ